MSLRRLALIAAVAASCTSARASESALQAGEELQYKVSYGFVRLGTIFVRTTRDSANPSEYHVAVIARSNPMIPFVNIKEYNESLVSAATLFPRYFYGKYETSSEHEIVREQFDPPAHCIFYSWADPVTGALLRCDTVRDVPPHYVDGPSLLLFARTHSACGCVERVPTFVSGKMSSTTLDFRHAREFIDIEAFHAPIRTRRYEGYADWSHSADGITGAFTGWVSDDDAAVPIQAQMKIIVGSITLELEKWNRAGWQPPT